VAYTAYERVSGSCLAEVEALCRHLTNNGTFDSTTHPNQSQVETFLTDGYDKIGSILAANGYAKEQTNTDILGVLQPFNAFYAASMIELTQPSVGYEGGENTRYARFFQEFNRVEEFIKSPAFARLGATKSWQESDYLTCGGISISDKEDIEADSDHPDYSFTRKTLRHPSLVSSTDISEERR